MRRQSKGEAQEHATRFHEDATCIRPYDTTKLRAVRVCNPCKIIAEFCSSAPHTGSVTVADLFAERFEIFADQIFVVP